MNFNSNYLFFISLALFSHQVPVSIMCVCVFELFDIGCIFIVWVKNRQILNGIKKERKGYRQSL